ncbi:thioesterase family protein [Alteromonadaceae bacterium M269]|nr:thioesterase family protein [Alteromonadaceae bacterium M269]
MHFDQLLDATLEATANQSQLSINGDWSQGRTVYGGLSAALLYAAIKQQVSSERVVRAFTTNFVGPIKIDEPIAFEVEVLREGKNVTQASGRIIQGKNICLQGHACFGADRESKISVPNTDNHQMVLPKKAKFLPQIPKVTPKFLKNIDLAIDQGGLPFTGRKTSHIHGWMRFKQPPMQIHDTHLIALIDAWPPTVLQMMKWPAPASSMSWNIDFIHPKNAIAPTDWFAYQADTRKASGGYAHTEANIWDSSGDLIAISRQTVTVFD